MLLAPQQAADLARMLTRSVALATVDPQGVTAEEDVYHPDEWPT